MSDDRVRDAAYEAYLLLRVGFTVAPILFGIDKFFNWTVHWPDYLAGWINNIAPGSGQDFMYFVGAVEIVAGLAVAVRAVARPKRCACGRRGRHAAGERDFVAA